MERRIQRYKLDDNAYVRIFKQNTINSSFYIMIPSTQSLDDDAKSDTPWFLQGSDGVDKRQKVDLNLGDNGDLNFSSTGDLQLSYGMSNAIQALKLKMMVEAGELRRHPDYGLDPVIGLSNSNVALIKKILTDSINTMIRSDERFAGINRLDIEYGRTTQVNAASAFSVNLIVRLAGSGQLLPITFSINK